MFEAFKCTYSAMSGASYGPLWDSWDERQVVLKGTLVCMAILNIVYHAEDACGRFENVRKLFGEGKLEIAVDAIASEAGEFLGFR